MRSHEILGQFFPWNRLGGYKIINGHVVLFGLPRRSAAGDKEVRLEDIPNYLVLLELLEKRDVFSQMSPTRQRG